MRATEREGVLDVLESAFGIRSLFSRYMDTDPLFDPADILIALDGERPVACVQIFEKRIRLAGREIRLGGVGSVATHPDYRSRGLARRLLSGSDDRMRDRGMPLGLLFTGITPFYAQLGWVQASMDLIQLRIDPARVTPTSTAHLRPFGDSDLAAVMEMYDGNWAHRDGSTLRDRAYWLGQLQYAGTPEENFVVAERDGQLVAYAREADFAGCHVMEHASRPGETAALVELVLSLVPTGRRLFIRSPPAELERGLRGAGATIEHLRDPGPMWRVLDAEALTRLAEPGAGVEQPLDDEALIDELIRKPEVHFWLTDRF